MPGDEAGHSTETTEGPVGWGHGTEHGPENILSGLRVDRKPYGAANTNPLFQPFAQRLKHRGPVLDRVHNVKQAQYFSEIFCPQLRHDKTPGEGD